ncbi:hypothetical protein Y1Q_0017121 [Alligator mississippiensis]|uniref:Uncharacterized protein n=1 Tax=Alligator mississippiensis TaxID=8496 RepID=A0A151MNZ7_ALLMI|nr:hypothetical protein Y1Q_0017121 [Alligator mississippiensis]
MSLLVQSLSHDEEAILGTSADKTPTGTEGLATLRALLPKVDLLAQLAARYTEHEEGEERVEDDLESEQQWEEEEELQQIEETTPVKSSPYLWSPLGATSAAGSAFKTPSEDAGPAIPDDIGVGTETIVAALPPSACSTAGKRYLAPDLQS